MSSNPNYVGAPVVGTGTLTTGSTSRTAPTNTVDIFAPGITGGMCQRVVITPLATTTATVVRIFRVDAAAAFHLITEVALPITTVTASGAVVPYTLEAVSFPTLFPLLLPSVPSGTAWKLAASINDTQTGVGISGEGGQF